MAWLPRAALCVCFRHSGTWLSAPHGARKRNAPQVKRERKDWVETASHESKQQRQKAQAGTQEREFRAERARRGISQIQTAVGMLSSRVARNRLSALQHARPTPQRAVGLSGSGLAVGIPNGGCETMA